jgi:hypothetical protein
MGTINILKFLSTGECSNAVETGKSQSFKNTKSVAPKPPTVKDNEAFIAAEKMGNRSADDDNDESMKILVQKQQERKQKVMMNLDFYNVSKFYV